MGYLEAGTIVNVTAEEFFYQEEIEVEGIKYHAEKYSDCMDDCYHCNQCYENYYSCPREGTGEMKITGRVEEQEEIK